MSKQSDIYNAIVTQLQGSSALSYINDVLIFKGARDNLTNFPCIIVETRGASEDELEVNSKVQIRHRFFIEGYVKITDQDLQIAGSGSIKGILDLENDITKALYSDRTLSGAALNLKITEIQHVYFEQPVRMTSIEIEVLYRQDQTTRS